MDANVHHTRVIVPVIALLGRKDEPTDALEEYCRYLGDALRPYDIQLEIRRVPWEVHGWARALSSLQIEADDWRGTWVLLQYTALAWSARGFPRRVLSTLKILRSAGARIAIVYHDVEPYPGSRLIDRFRRMVQLRTMRRALSLSDLAVFTVPLNKVSWLSRPALHAHFIPVGPNLPIPEGSSSAVRVHDLPTIGVFSITGGISGARETQVILSTVRYAAERLGNIRLLVFGRHAELREAELRDGLKNSPVEICVDGILQPDQVIKKLFACDLLLFIRGPISSRRGSALAGIACGLPVIAFEGLETAPPVTDAGVVLVEQSKPDDLNAAVVRVLSDDLYRSELAARSRHAYQSYFSWHSIAVQIAGLLDTH